jgi:hypothetical protein
MILLVGLVGMSLINFFTSWAVIIRLLKI